MRNFAAPPQRYVIACAASDGPRRADKGSKADVELGAGQQAIFGWIARRDDQFPDRRCDRRDHRAFAIWGADSAGATDYVAATGIMTGPGSAPLSIDLNLIRVETGNGSQYGWDGQLLPVS
jgi:hypothetical protein